MRLPVAQTVWSIGTPLRQLRGEAVSVAGTHQCGPDGRCTRVSRMGGRRRRAGRRLSAALAAQSLLTSGLTAADDATVQTAVESVEANGTSDGGLTEVMLPEERRQEHEAADQLASNGWCFKGIILRMMFAV